MLLAIVAPAAAQQKAPNLTLKDIHGKTLKLSDLRGGVVLLNFWATWCVPCRTEIPDLIKKQREYRHRGLRIIGITYPPQQLSRVRRFVRAVRVNYPIALGSQATKQVFTPSETLPLTVIIDRRGNISGIIEGVLYEDEFDRQVKPLLTPAATR
ncbi:MAG TPA: TlpA disulfide reductase family protein [Pyrinomonadaceae bacterium]